MIVWKFGGREILLRRPGSNSRRGGRRIAASNGSLGEVSRRLPQPSRGVSCRGRKATPLYRVTSSGLRSGAPSEPPPSFPTPCEGSISLLWRL
jgi:hypothetical protein